MRDTCYFCHARWGECTCQFADVVDPSGVQRTPAPEDGFTWEGFLITAPNVDETGRFYVDPVEYYGEAFERWQERRHKQEV